MPANCAKEMQRMRGDAFVPSGGHLWLAAIARLVFRDTCKARRSARTMCLHLMSGVVPGPAGHAMNQQGAFV